MKYTAYTNRQRTDAFFTPDAGSAAYHGQAADAVGYIEQAQLLDPALWKLFVDQFRQGNVDNHDEGWRTEYWGKMMRGACFTYAYTQNEQLYKVLEDTVRDLLTTADQFGRITTYTVPAEFHGWDLWGRKYVMLGFQYFLEICKDDALADKVIAVMCRHADYLLRKIGNGEIGKLPITMTSATWDGLNSSSILEPFVRLYNLTGETRYLNFAKGIIDAGGTRNFNIFEAAFEGILAPYQYSVTKAYEMISNFEGILEYYRVTGEEKYKTMCLNFARLVMESDITVIGSAGTTHELFDHSAVRQFDPKFNGIMQETCVTVTWMKFCHQLLCLTGDPVFADQIERSMYNALLGAINVNRHVCRGQVFTFDSYSPLLNGWRGREVGGRKDIIPGEYYWGCCVAIGAAGTALVPMTAVMKTRDGAAVNLFLPGESKTALPCDKTLTLRTETAYPVEGKVTITVDPEEECAFSLRIRIPAWSKETMLTVNGTSVETAVGTYAVIDRTWAAGDKVELTLDLRTKVLHAADIDPLADEESICHAALQRGPIMLARDSQFGENIREAVTLVEADGYVDVSPCTVEIPMNQSYKVRTAEGEITVGDYASAGQNWDKDLPITVWITTK